MLLRLIYLTLFVPIAALAQGDKLSLSQGPATSPETVSLNVQLQSSSGQQAAGIQWTLSYSPADFTAIQVTAGPTAIAAGKSVSCAGTSAAYECLVVGVNSNTIPDGVLAVISLTVSRSASDTTSFVQLQNPIAASPSGLSIPISAAGLAVTITPAAGTISVTSQSVQFAYTMGGTVPQGQSIQIASRGGALNWTATWTEPWLNVEPSSGTTPSTIVVSVLPASLAVSTYTDTIQISAGGSGGQMTISVTLTVNAPTHFVPIVPCRIADTRSTDGAFGGPAVNGGSSRDFAIPNGACGIPPNATAYSLNVAVVPAHTLGYVTVWPAGQPQPLVATLNSVDGRIKSNAAIVAAGADGAIRVFATDTTELILDINGYFVPAGATGALAFYPLAPCRIADTRNPSGLLGGPDLAAHGIRAFPITDSNCDVPGASRSYSLNFTALPKGSLGYLTAWPVGERQPVVASLNAVTGATTANAVIVPAGTNGDINVFANDSTDLLIDTNGYFAPPGSGGLALYNLAPCRVLDTRHGGGSPFSGAMEVTVSGTCGVPSTARAYVFNATVVPSGALNFLTLWQQGAPQPLVSTLNAVDGAITSNMAIVPAASGAIEVFASDRTQLILDIFGYFAP
ncbi:MAG TPA: cohesin domain-containing protein [Bryobacteraceae bacterium]|nr:cohesin domain-containing protein [Bryobacteraceae bacterium]